MMLRRDVFLHVPNMSPRGGIAEITGGAHRRGFKRGLAEARPSEDSLATCVRNLWPHIVDGGYLFTDECLNPSYISLFFSERWWKENLDTSPPGLIGGGTGLGLGTFYVGPHTDRQSHPLQYPGTGAYTQKNAMTGLWTYYPRTASRTDRARDVRESPPT